MSKCELPDLWPLLRAYCDFYEVSPTDADLFLAQSRALLRWPEEGLLLLTRNEVGTASGFATLLWSWDTTFGGRTGIMHDVFVLPEARGVCIATAIIGECTRRARERVRASRLADRTRQRPCTTGS